MSRDPQALLQGRYQRIAAQLEELYAGYRDPTSRMASAAALLHHKMSHFSWTGFYRLVAGELLVGPYQGPLACAVLEPRLGVCWACVERGQPLLVPDVELFEGHIACDARTRSEVVVPVRDGGGELVAVLDVDARRPGAFCEVDVAGLSRIAEMIYRQADTEEVTR